MPQFHFPRWLKRPVTAEDAEDAEVSQSGGMGPVAPRLTLSKCQATTNCGATGPLPSLRSSASSASSAVIGPFSATWVVTAPAPGSRTRRRGRAVVGLEELAVTPVLPRRAAALHAQTTRPGGKLDVDRIFARPDLQVVAEHGGALAGERCLEQLTVLPGEELDGTVVELGIAVLVAPGADCAADRRPVLARQAGADRLARCRTGDGDRRLDGADRIAVAARVVGAERQRDHDASRLGQHDDLVLRFIVRDLVLDQQFLGSHRRRATRRRRRGGCRYRSAGCGERIGGIRARVDLVAVEVAVLVAVDTDARTLARRHARVGQRETRPAGKRAHLAVVAEHVGAAVAVEQSGRAVHDEAARLELRGDR